MVLYSWREGLRPRLPILTNDERGIYHDGQKEMPYQEKAGEEGRTSQGNQEDGRRGQGTRSVCEEGHGRG